MIGSNLLKMLKISNISHRYLFVIISLFAIYLLYSIISYKNENSLNNSSKNQITFQIDSLPEDEEQEEDEFYLNPETSICGDPAKKSYLFITFVVIAPHLFTQRNHIRNTWASKQFSSDFKVIFSVGFSKNQTINEQIKEEFELYHDILQISNLIDSYYSCSIKIMKTYK